MLRLKLVGNDARRWVASSSPESSSAFSASARPYHEGGKLDAKIAEIAALRTEAGAINRDSAHLHAASDDDISVMLGKLTATLDKLHRLHDEAVAALASLMPKSGQSGTTYVAFRAKAHGWLALRPRLALVVL